MKWNEAFDFDHPPSTEDIQAYIGALANVWNEWTNHLENTYLVKPQLAYSKCPMQPGWNVKYKKGGKVLCTLYPMDGYFIALVVVGAKQDEDVGFVAKMGELTKQVTELYSQAPSYPMGKWLMIEVKDKSTLKDLKFLTEIRLKPKK